MELAFEDQILALLNTVSWRFNPFYNGTGFRRKRSLLLHRDWFRVSILFIMELAFEVSTQASVYGSGTCFNPFYNGTGFRRLRC